MKYIKTLLPCSLLALALYSCGSKDWETTLYAQKIEGTSKILYQYDAWTGMDTHAFGYMLLDSTETFDVNPSDNLPFSYLEGIPSAKMIQGVEFERPNQGKTDKIFTPAKKLHTSKEGIAIAIKLYQYAGFMARNGGFEEFEFNSFRETRDSLVFYDLTDVKSVKNQHLDSLKLKKGNILIQQDQHQEVIALDIDDLILNKGSDEMISNIKYRLIPKNKTKSSAFSDYGVFKEVFLP